MWHATRVTIHRTTAVAGLVGALAVAALSGPMPAGGVLAGPGPGHGGAAATSSAVVATSATPATSTLPTIVALRAGHHSGFDRFVLEFDRNRAPAASVAYVPELIGDFSGAPVPVPGRAVLRIVVRGAQAHTDDGVATVGTDRAFALPNIMAVRGAGDFEGVVTLGLGLAKRMPFHVHRFTNPGRIAIDVSTAFARTTRTIYFLGVDEDGDSSARGVRRAIPNAHPVSGLLDRVFAGPTLTEQMRGLRLVASGATGFTSVRVRDRVARVRLAGGCRAAGMSFTIADEITRTLRPLARVRWVKVYDPSGSTRHPSGRRDSQPTCLTRSAGTCLYLVRDLQQTGSLYTGGFLVAHVLDGDLVGSAGAFYSEWHSVRGTLGAAGTDLQSQDESGQWRPWPQTWLPEQGTLQGWTPVSAAQLRTYSGGGVPLVGQPCG